MLSLKKMFHARDMTVGKPWKNLLAFTVPMLIGNIAQQMYTAVDAIVVGRFVGDDALAAIGGTTALFMLLLTFFIGISSGAGIMVAQYFGAKRRDDLSYTIGASIIITAAVGVVLMIVGPLATRPLLTILKTPETIIDMSVTYINILLWGVMGVASYNILAGVLRGLGDSFSPFVYLLISSVLSALLNILFVGYFRWGVAGAAISTIFCQFLSGVLCMLRLMKMRNVFDIGWKYIWSKKQYVKEVVRLGVPTGISQAVFSLSMVLVQPLINGFGEYFISVHKIVMTIDGFIIMPIFSFANAAMAFTGQNVGAGKMDRVNLGARQCALLSFVFTTFIVVLVLVFSRPVAGLFTETAEIMEISTKMLRILAPGFIVMSVGQVFWHVIRGAGDTMTPMWASLIATAGIRVPGAYLFVHMLGTPQSVYYATVITWISISLLGIGAYYRGNWQNKGVVRYNGKEIGEKVVKAD